jgi:hypothetical protein
VAALLLAAGPAGAADEDAIFTAARAAIADKRLRQSQVLGFHDRNQTFSEVPAQGALLVGFDCGVGAFGNIETVYALRAIYRTAKGKVCLNDHGLFEDQPLGAGRVLRSKVLRRVRILARPGYAVGSITVRSGLNINGLSVTFMRIDGTRLNPQKCYESPWVGDRTGGGERFQAGYGAPVVGVFGSEDEVQVKSLGLWFMKPPAVPPPPDPEPAEAPPKAADPPPKAPEPAAAAPAGPPAAAEKNPPTGTAWLPVVIFAAVTVPVFLVLLVSVGRKGRATDPDAEGRPQGSPAGGAPPRSGPWPEPARNAESPQQARARREVVWTLFGIAALQFLCGLAVLAVAPDLILGGPVPPQALRTIAVVVIGIALAYTGLGLWAIYQPLPAAGTGLALYLVVFLLDILANPEMAMRGIIIKIAIIAALIKAIQSAAKTGSSWGPGASGSFPGPRGSAPPTPPWGGAGRRPDPVGDPNPAFEARGRAPRGAPGPVASTAIQEEVPVRLADRSEPFPSPADVLPPAARRQIADELWERIRAREERPWWVQVGLWGIHSRATAWAFFWISVGLAVVPTVLFFAVNKGFVLCGLFGVAALWYWLCIRWADEHGGWT